MAGTALVARVDDERLARLDACAKKLKLSRQDTMRRAIDELAGLLFDEDPGSTAGSRVEPRGAQTATDPPPARGSDRAAAPRRSTPGGRGGARRQAQRRVRRTTESQVTDGAGTACNHPVTRRLGEGCAKCGTLTAHRAKK